MTTTLVKPNIEHLGPLAVARPGDDPFQDYYVERLDAGITRMLPKLARRVQPRLGDELDALLELYQAFDPQIRRQILTHPYLSYWWVKVYESATSGAAELDRWLREFARLLIVPAVLNDLWPGDLEVETIAHLGALRLAGGTYDVRVPLDEGDVLVRVSEGELRVTSSAGVETVPVEQLLKSGGPALLTRPMLPGTAIELDGADRFVAYLFASINAKPPLEGYGKRDLETMVATERMMSCFAEAHELLATAWPDVAAELHAYTRVIVPYRSRISSTFTEAAFMGAVFMSEAKKPFASALFTAEHLLHEHSHLRLTLIQAVDPLFSCDPQRLFTSPWRKDPRPLIGILHGAFVFARIARFLEAICMTCPDATAEKRREEVLGSLRDALTVLTSAGGVSYTPLGECLLDEIRGVA